MEHSAPVAVVLADRAAWDALAHYRAAQVWRRERPDRHENDRLTLLASTQAEKYSLLLASVLDPTLPVTGAHCHDTRYRALVDRHIHRLLAEQNIPHERVTSGTESHAHAVELALRLCLTEAAS